MQLPPLLEAWRPWLSLFPADLAVPLGELLLRLHRQIGPLRSTPSRADALPEGVGSIVQRGPYERMLITEWAYADAEPDEFIRRAGSGELMFTGPEPAARRRSRRCIALFDAGPSQLGEPRLLHLALFILLARRAEEAGALFEWGILQDPPVLHRESGMRAIQNLLKARTLSGVGDAARLAWEDAIDSATDDAWIIGGDGQQRSTRARGQVAIRRSLLSENLEVSLTMHQATRALTLVLPAPALGVRLLRSPFEPIAIRANIQQAQGRPSLQQPPRFAAFGQWLAVPQLDGSVLAYHVPKSNKSTPGKALRFLAPASGDFLGVGLFGKALGCIVGDSGALTFRGFPSEALGPKHNSCERPPSERFRAPPKMASWLQTFFVRRVTPVIIKPGEQAAPFDLKGRHEEANVLAIDIDRRLGCWTSRCTKNAGVLTNTSISFRLISENVIGAVQFDQYLLFGCARADTTDVYSWNATVGSAQRTTVPRTGTRLCFGNRNSWSDPREKGLVALQCSDTEWLVGMAMEWITMTIEDHASVLGVAMSHKLGVYGLLVRSADKMRIELRTRFQRHVLITSPEPIAQASMHPATGHIAWIGEQSLRICVHAIDEEKPYLRVSMDGEDNAK